MRRFWLKFRLWLCTEYCSRHKEFSKRSYPLVGCESCEKEMQQARWDKANARFERAKLHDKKLHRYAEELEEMDRYERTARM